MTALALIALAGLGYAVHAASRGDWMPLIVFAFCSAVYGVVWAADRLAERDERAEI